LVFDQNYLILFTINSIIFAVSTRKTKRFTLIRKRKNCGLLIKL
jgi:hypothetical protein